jgi:hypothetical protein
MDATSDEPSGAARPRLDPGPFMWALAAICAFLVVWLLFEFVGEQRYHNTELWQRWHPVTQSSAEQTALPVENADHQGMDFSVVQTERGVYFLTGAKYAPAAGDKIVVQTNGRWDLYLCAATGGRCMTIHSFCADTTLANLKRDEQGRIQNCYAPYYGSGKSNQAVAAITTPPADRRGREGGRAKLVPAAGMTHPSEWAWRMGLPRPTAQESTPEPVRNN